MRPLAERLDYAAAVLVWCAVGGLAAALLWLLVTDDWANSGRLALIGYGTAMALAIAVALTGSK